MTAFMLCFKNFDSFILSDFSTVAGVVLQNKLGEEFSNNKTDIKWFAWLRAYFAARTVHHSYMFGVFKNN